MAYDVNKDPWRNHPHIDALGRTSRSVTPNDSNDIDPYPKAVVVTEAGDLSVLPVANADEDAIVFTDCPVGFIPPFRVRRVLEATTASVATIED